ELLHRLIRSFASLMMPLLNVLRRYMKSRIILSGMQILVEQQWLQNHAILLEQGLIKAIILKDMIPHHLPAKHYQFPNNYYLIPGLIDLHIHGANGHDVMDGKTESLFAI